MASSSAHFLNAVLVAVLFLVGLTSAAMYEECTFYSYSWPYSSTQTCTYGCCTDECCTYSQYWSSTYTDTASTAIQAWLIAVIVVGSIIGLVTVVSIIVCIVFACKGSTGSRGSVVRPTQAGVTVISGGTTTTQWAQPYGQPYAPGYGPQGGAVPPPYTYNNPAYNPAYGGAPPAPTPGAGTSQPAYNPAYGSAPPAATAGAGTSQPDPFASAAGAK